MHLATWIIKIKFKILWSLLVLVSSAHGLALCWIVGTKILCCTSKLKQKNRSLDQKHLEVLIRSFF